MKNSTRKKAAPPEIQFGTPTITPAAGPANTSTTTEIGGQAAILFSNAVVDLQTTGPLAGAWAGTIVFPLNAAVAQDTRVTLDFRGAINKSAGSAAVLFAMVDGATSAKHFAYKRSTSDDYTWRISQRLVKGVTVLSLELFLGAERRTTDDFVSLNLETIDIVQR